MPHRDTPFLKGSIELDSYIIANLLLALEHVPATGEWHSLLQERIGALIEAQGYNFNEFYYPANLGMNVATCKRHLNFMDLKEKHGWPKGPTGPRNGISKARKKALLPNGGVLDEDEDES